jgi:hypothetical protein
MRRIGTTGFLTSASAVVVGVVGGSSPVHWLVRARAFVLDATGTGDISNYVRAGDGFDYAASRGGFVAMNGYCHALGSWAADMLSAAWNTEPLQDYRLCGNMFMIRTPLQWQWYRPPGSTLEEATADSGFPERVASGLFSVFGIQGQFFLYKAAVYVRISVQVVTEGCTWQWCMHR